MFQLEELKPPERWQEVLDRDGSFVTSTTIREHVVVRRATKEDRLVAFISALTVRGDIVWKEEINKRPGQFDRHSYETLLPGTSMWKVSLCQDYERINKCHLLISRGKGDTAVVHDPQVPIHKLYYRLYELGGHPVMHFNSLDDPDFRRIHEKEQALIDSGLGVLELAVKGP